MRRGVVDGKVCCYVVASVLLVVPLQPGRESRTDDWERLLLLWLSAQAGKGQVFQYGVEPEVA